MEVWASAGVRLYIASRAEDANGLFVAADSTPVSGDYSIREGGSNTNLAGSHSISVEDHCYLNIFTPTTALTVGLFIEVQLTAVYSGVTKYDFGSCIVGATATANNVTVSPIAGNTPERVEQTTIRAFVGEDWSEAISGVDANGDAINFNTLGTLQFSITDYRKTEVLVIADASIATTSTTFTVTIPASVLTYGTVLHWSLRDLTDGNKVILYGPIEVGYAADDDGV